MVEFNCYKCGHHIVREGHAPFGRSEDCPTCRADVRVCKNCRHYDAMARWECREHIPESIRDKEKANFCDYFQVLAAPAKGDPAKPVVDPREAMLKAAEALFKKK